MAEPCPNVPRCPLFPLFRMKTSLAVWQVQYCEGKYEGCARYKLSRAGQPVPQNLLPNGSKLNAA